LSNTSSTSSLVCPSRKLHIWFETFTIPDQLIIYGAKAEESLPEECSTGSSSTSGPSSSSSSNILLDTGLISTNGWQYFCVEVPSDIVQYKYEVYAPTPGTAWLIDIQSTCDTLACGTPTSSSSSASSSNSMRALFSYFDVNYS
jgi:hypothetical protein